MRNALLGLPCGLILAACVAGGSNEGAPPAPVAAPDAGASITIAARPGEVTQFRVPLSDDLRRIAGQGALSPVDAAAVALAVPRDFDAARPWPILIVNRSADLANNGAARSTRYYAEAALPAGWIVLSADALQPDGAAGDNLWQRYALIKAALAALAVAWPGSAQWPIAFAGFSGGAKAAGVLGLISTMDGRPPVGVFMGGCNEAVAAELLSQAAYRPYAQRYRQVPLFISSGADDPVATPDQQRAVEQDFAAAGFAHVRLESYWGDHSLSLPQVRMALEWFAAPRRTG
jgi:hypothetical protein